MIKMCIFQTVNVKKLHLGNTRNVSSSSFVLFQKIRIPDVLKIL